MVDPFDSKYRALFGALDANQKNRSLLSSYLDEKPATTSPVANALASAVLFPPPSNGLLPKGGLGERTIFNALLDYTPPPPPRNRLAGALPMGGLLGLAQLEPIKPDRALPVAREPVKRKAFFSFHYADIMRVNNVRQEGKVSKRSTDRNFYDRSLWESKKLEGDEALKRLIREGMEGASAVCVLIGSDTWSRPWVKYEIARAIVDQRGLFGVHINGLRHHERKQPDPLGFNPFNHMGIHKGVDGKFRIFEQKLTYNPVTGRSEWQWHYYSGYTSAVDLPKYMTAPPPGYIMPLASAVEVYDYCHPMKDLGAWIDRAASRAGY